MQSSIVFSGNANRPFAEKVAEQFGVTLGDATVKTFSDGESWVEIKTNVRGADVFVIQPTCPPVNDHLMELVIMIDALRRASARRITAVLPYFGYARQDMKKRSKTPISAKVVAGIIELVGARRVLTMDLHAGQIQGFFNVPVDHLFARRNFLTDIRKRFSENIIMVSPDAGGVERTRSYAKRLGCGIAIIDKRRDEPNEVEEMNVVGNVRGKTAILFDDMVDTAGTLSKGADALLEAGASEVHAYASHPVLSGGAIANITNSGLKTLTVSDTIPLKTGSFMCSKIRVESVADTFALAIKAINEEGSVSELF